MAIIVDSYSESNVIDAIGIGNIDTQSGQSFSVSVGGTLNSCAFYLFQDGSPTGYCYAKIYAHSGTYGTSSLPTGDALAVSDAVDVSTLDINGALKTFTFSGGNKITLSDSTYYVVSFAYTRESAGQLAFIGICGNGHAGNRSYFTNAWYSDANSDDAFYIYKDSATSIKDIIQSGIVVFPR